MVSFDGFRWDYMDHIATPHLDKVARDGFRVRSMTPAFPSLTFTNHYSLVTGASPIDHGIVSNHFYDTQLHQPYSMYQNEDVTNPQWYTAPAIWEVAKAQGLSQAAYFWVGSEMEGRNPDFFVPFDSKTTPETVIGQVLDWLDPAKAPSPELILAYFPMVDKAGHRYGPDSPELIFAVQQADDVVGALMAGVAQLGVHANFLFVSDHGMTPIDYPPIDLDAILAKVDASQIRYVANNYSQVDLYLVDEQPEKAKQFLETLPQGVGYRWLYRDDAPFATHPTRNGSILGIADQGFQFQYQRRSSYLGSHGYDAAFPDMGAICMGVGPGFAPGTSLEQVRVTDVFNLLTHLLNLESNQREADSAIWRPILKPD